MNITQEQEDIDKFNTEYIDDNDDDVTG